LKDAEDYYIELARSRLNSFDCVLDIDAIHDKSLPQNPVENFKELTKNLYGKPCELELLQRLNSSPAAQKEPIQIDFFEDNCRLDKIILQDNIK